MAKVALLIGVSVYEPGLNPLPGAINDVDAMQQVLVRPDIGDFVDSDITVLKNPNRQKMEEEIERLFANRQKNDLILLFYSGHGIKDDVGKLYLTTCHTRKNPRGELIRSSAVSANFVHENMERSRSKRQVVMLDSCFSGAFADGLSAKDDGAINIHEQLGGEGRAILTSSSSTQYSFGSNQGGSELSIYTRYLIEGMMTGAADLDEDGIVSINELHEYASKKVREIQPAMKPMIYAVREGFKIKLTKVPPGDPKDKYCKEVKRYINRGELSFVGRKILDALKIRCGLSDADATEIENEMLDVARQEFRNKLQHYERDFSEAIQQEKPLTEIELGELQQKLKQILGLRNEDTQPIEARVRAYKEHLQQYEQAFIEALEKDYPLSETTRHQFQKMQQQWELTTENITVIESRITAEIEAYRNKLQQYEQAFTKAIQKEYPLSDYKMSELRQEQQNLGLKPEDITSIENRITTEIEIYRNKLQQYEEIFTKSTQQEYPLSKWKLNELHQERENLGLKKKDSVSIESRITAEIEAYRNKLQQYKQLFTKATQQEYPLSDYKKSELRQEQQNLGLKPEDIVSIENRITTEIEIYRNKLRQYEEIFTNAIRQEYPLSENKLNELHREHENLGLKEEDCVSINNRITTEIETYRKKLQQYEQSFVTTIQQEYHLTDLQRNELKQIQQHLNLLETDITPIETRIIAKLEEYLQKLQQYKEVLAQTIKHEYPFSKEIREELKRYQCILELKDEDIAKVEQELMTSGNVIYHSDFAEIDNWPQEILGLSDLDINPIKAKLVTPKNDLESSSHINNTQKQEEYKKKLQIFEQAVDKAIQSKKSLYVRNQLRWLQYKLGLSDSDVASIEDKYIQHRNKTT